MAKRIAPLLITASIISLGLTACGGSDGDNKADPPKSPPPVSSSAAVPPSTAPTTAPPSAGAPSTGAPAPGAPAGDVIMIDPDGKKYGRQQMVNMAAELARAAGKNLPANFCEVSYREGVKGGGKFPAGKQAFIDVCQQGLKQAG